MYNKLILIGAFNRWLFLLLSLFAQAFVKADEQWPEFNTEIADIIIVAGNVINAKYLPDLVNPKCKSGELVCMDPPPMKFKIEIESVVYGEFVEKEITAYTTSHFGLNQFNIIDAQPYLFILKSDGKDFILPRYQFDLLAYTKNDELALPMESSSDILITLPCDVRKLHKTLDFAPSIGNVLLPIEEFEHYDSDQMNELKKFAHVSKYAVRVVRGIELEEMRKYFINNSTQAHEFMCSKNTK